MRNVFVIAVGLAALALTGCVEPGPEVTPTASPGEPVFASEEEALAAAEEVFAQYVEATTLTGSSGGQDLSGFEGILTDRKFDEEAAYAEELAASGQRLVGAYGFFGFELQQADTSEPVFVQVYVCLDLTDVKYVDAQGNDLSAESPITASPLEVVLVGSPSDPSILLIDQLERWTGEDFCS